MRAQQPTKSASALLPAGLLLLHLHRNMHRVGQCMESSCHSLCDDMKHILGFRRYPSIHRWVAAASSNRNDQSSDFRHCASSLLKA